jgi:hypothetical protein
MSTRPITDELVQQVIEDLRERYALDGDDVRALGTKLADPDAAVRRAENVEFAERFAAEHPATLQRLAQ